MPQGGLGTGKTAPAPPQLQTGVQGSSGIGRQQQAFGRSMPQAHRPQQYQQFASPVGIPRRDDVDFSSLSTTPNPLTPLDQHAFSFGQTSNFGQSFGQQHSTTPLEAPPISPWGIPNQSTAPSPIDWSSPSSWLMPGTSPTVQTQEVDQDLLNQLSSYVSDQNQQDFDALIRSLDNPQGQQTMMQLQQTQQQQQFQQQQQLQQQQNQQSQTMPFPTFSQQLANQNQQFQQTQSPLQGSLLSRQMQSQQGNLPNGQANGSYNPLPSPMAQSFGQQIQIQGMSNAQGWQSRNGTPVTTPGGSDTGFGFSPIEVSYPVLAPGTTKLTKLTIQAGPSRMAPPPNPASRAQSIRQGSMPNSASASPCLVQNSTMGQATNNLTQMLQQAVPSPQLQQMQPAVSAQTSPFAQAAQVQAMMQSIQNTPVSTPPAQPAPTQPQQFEQLMAGLSNVNLSNLPPLPTGLDPSQFGAMGFEMAIRMGMGIAMGMQQQQSQQPSPAVSSSSNPNSAPSQNAQTAPTSNNTKSSAGTPSSMQTTSPDMRKKSAVNVQDILSDDFLTSTVTSPAPIPSFHNSRRPSVEAMSPPPLASPDDMVKRDPLATQVWKAYSKAKEQLPNGPRMENLTWRMMHLTLQKEKEREREKERAAAALEAARTAQANASGMESGFTAVPGLGSSLGTVKEEKSATSPADDFAPEQERGRSKGKSRVVGFSGSRPPGTRLGDDV